MSTKEEESVIRGLLIILAIILVSCGTAGIWGNYVAWIVAGSLLLCIELLASYSKKN